MIKQNKGDKEFGLEDLKFFMHTLELLYEAYPPHRLAKIFKSISDNDSDLSDYDLEPLQNIIESLFRASYKYPPDRLSELHDDLELGLENITVN